MGGIGARIAWLALVFAVNSMPEDGSRCGVANMDFLPLTVDKAASRSGIDLEPRSVTQWQRGLQAYGRAKKRLQTNHNRTSTWGTI